MMSNTKQQEIKDELSKLGWSMADFVKEYNKYLKYKSGLTEDTFKKQLYRDTTNPALLGIYLKFISSHDEWLKLGSIRPVFTSKEKFSLEFNEGMKRISKLISDSVEK
jgi:hypothetical protein